MTRADRQRYIRVRLAGCPRSADHTTDPDWMTNRQKQLCAYKSCQRALCEECAFRGKSDDPLYVLYCWEHRQYGKEPLYRMG